jgi:hypothetical protein
MAYRGGVLGVLVPYHGQDEKPPFEPDPINIGVGKHGAPAMLPPRCFRMLEPLQ